MASKKNDKAVLRGFKRKLRRWGMDEEEILLCVEQMRQRISMKKRGEIPLDAPLCTRAAYVKLLKKQPGTGNPDAIAVLRLGDDYEPPSDKGYKPTHVDPVLKGVARATGATAKSVKRSKAMTKFQYEKEA